MIKIISSLVNECSKGGWRYDKGSCFFNARIILSLILWMNLTSLYILIAGKKRALDIFFYKQGVFPIGLTLSLLFFFIILIVVSPKKKVFASIDNGIPNSKKNYIKFLGYVLLSILLMILAGVYGKQ